jgi:cyclic pyranopterin phosphate synthase
MQKRLGFTGGEMKMGGRSDYENNRDEFQSSYVSGEDIGSGDDPIAGSNIFNPQAKVIANLDRALEYCREGNTSPVLVEIDPSNVCNHSCSFCLSAHIHFEENRGLETFNRATMSKDMLISLCQEMIDMKVKAINWTGGGEPTINPALKDAIEFIGENSDIKMGIFTNGTLLTRFDLCGALADHFTWVRISVDAGTPETYNHVRRVQDGADWDTMMANLRTLIATKKSRNSKLIIGAGFVVSPDTAGEILDFARTFSTIDVDYCQFKPEIIPVERNFNSQQSADFWLDVVNGPLAEAQQILGSKYHSIAYRLNDLILHKKSQGRSYKKCLGSQIQPCIGADGLVYVCTNHRGHKKYSYGSLYEKSFREIWNDVGTRRKVMHQIEDVEHFSCCTQLCKPHESNKMMWHIHENMDNEDELARLEVRRQGLQNLLKDPEFI